MVIFFFILGDYIDCHEFEVSLGYKTKPHLQKQTSKQTKLLTSASILTYRNWTKLCFSGGDCGICVWSEGDCLSVFFSILIFETTFVTTPSAYRFGQTSWPVNFRGPSVSGVTAFLCDYWASEPMSSCLCGKYSASWTISSALNFLESSQICPSWDVFTLVIQWLVLTRGCSSRQTTLSVFDKAPFLIFLLRPLSCPVVLWLICVTVHTLA